MTLPSHASPDGPDSGSHSIDKLLADAGITELDHDSTPDTLRSVLTAFAEGTNDMNEQDRGLARNGAIQALKMAGVHGPAKIVDDALAASTQRLSLASDDLPDLLTQTEKMIADYTDDERDLAEFISRGEPLQIAPLLVDGLGHVGEPLNVKVAFTTMFSSMLEAPLSAEMVSTSAAGKSSLVDKTKMLFPPGVISEAVSASEKSFYYMRDLRNKIVIRRERDLAAEKEQGSLPLRELISNGRASRTVTIRNEYTGDQETRTYVTEGPIVHIDTSTSSERNDEDANRLIRITCDETEDQTARVHEAVVRQESLAYSRKGPRHKEWARGFQRYYLAVRRDVFKRRPFRVRVPFADEISVLLPKKPVKVRRLLPIILTVVRAVALARRRHHRLHQAADGGWDMYADAEDWRQASEIVNLLLANSLANVDRQAVRLLHDIRKKLGRIPTLTVPYVSELLGLPPSTVRSRLKHLVEAGFLEAHSNSPLGGRGNMVQYEPVGTSTAVAGALALPPVLPSSAPLPVPVPLRSDDKGANRAV